MAEPKQRFLILDDEGLENKNKKAKNVNTEKSDMHAHRAFTKFLEAYGKEGEDLEYWNYTASELDNYLAKFWFGAHKETPEKDAEESNKDGLTSTMYTANTLRNFRYALNRILKKKNTIFDLISKDNISFHKSNSAFENAIAELKKEGKGDVKSKKEITKDGKVFKSSTKFIFLADNYSVFSSMPNYKIILKK